MQVQISTEAAQAVVDSIEFAISTLTSLYDSDELASHMELGLADIRRSIEDLQMIRVSYMLIQRNAAKEQRKNRANQAEVRS
jgi:hypothetical protein